MSNEIKSSIKELAEVPAVREVLHACTPAFVSFV
jgi:hypothetical protein